MERRGKRRSHHMDDVSMMEEKRREWIRGEEGDLGSHEGEDVGEGAIEGGDEEDLGFSGWLGLNGPTMGLVVLIEVGLLIGPPL
jgi:hypothetical protein